MYYFAYALNLNKKQMAKICPESQPKFTVTLPNYKLSFTGWSRQWHGGTVSIKRFSGEKVRGAIYDISEQCLRRLDRDEGYPGSSNRFDITVFDEDGQSFTALTYIKAIQAEETKPSKEYLAIIQQGYREWGIV